VFAAPEIDLVKMIEIANGLRVDTLPPLVALRAVEEDNATAGVDYFTPADTGERLFDTPDVIARLARSTKYKRRIVVDAGATRDPNGRPLTFRWVVLRGDADRIRIRRSGKRGERAEIEIPWHDRYPVPTSPELQTGRVDIGVFADNGTNLSAPAFISFLFPGDQKRTYEADGRLRCVDYDDPAFRRRYVDPLLFPARDWRDCYQYDGNGALVGWNRISGASVQRFTRDGVKVVETDAAGRPARGEYVRYELKPPAKAGRPRVVQVPTGRFVTYRYQGADDRIGEMRPDPAR
jgi:hypothetical protein